MPSNTKKSVKRAASSVAARSNKRAKGTASQPIHVDSQAPTASLDLSPPPILNAFQALVTGSQAPTFEARIRESRDKDTITAPPEGSERAAAAASEAPDDNEDDEDEEFEEFDSHLKDKYEGIDWSRLKKFQKPLTTHKYRKSWVYKYGYCVVERHNPRRVH